MAFHEVSFPANLSFGSLGGPERRTEIVALTNGHEERSTPWAHSRRRYDAGMGLRSIANRAMAAGGDVWISSTAGVGTRIAVRLPA